MIENKFDLKSYYIEIIGKKEIILTGCYEIIELESTMLKIKCNEHVIIFRGNNIELLSYDTESLNIAGDINRIELL